MLRFVTFAAILFSFAALASPAKASADSSCYPEWNLYNRNLGCAHSAVIAPGNDTRANLLLLLTDRTGAARYPDLEWEIAYARNFYSWQHLVGAVSPAAAVTASSNNYRGSRCASFPSASAAFRKAVAANRKISTKDRETLGEMRGFIEDVCKGKDYRGRPPSDLAEIMSNADSVLGGLRLGSKAANQYTAYLRGASLFYGGEFADAQQAFLPLVKSKDKWLKETATYMLARVQLNAAQENSFGRWGDFKGADSADQGAVDAAEAGFRRYLTKYPGGRYATSARGLIRRVYWLRQDLGKLSAEYGRLLTENNGINKAGIIEEIDNILLFAKGASAQAVHPEILAAILLMRMRQDQWREIEPVTKADLMALKDRFDGRDDLHELLLANHAFYVAGDAQQVLELIPDAARQPDFTYLEFSRQALRGLALQALDDRNEGGFWRDMLTGSKSLYQRPAVELGLATFYERRGQLDKVFAANSPIQDAAIRKILLQRVASPKILRAASRNTSRPKDERELALFILLYKNLAYGDYQTFLKDQAAITEDANTDAGLWQLPFQTRFPLGLFTSAARRGEYTCPSFTRTVQTLARAPKNASARLCLGDFWLQNGFDYFNLDVTPSYVRRDDKKPSLTLGDSKSQFPGRAIPRHDIYTDIIADRQAKAAEKSYALYRAIRCYATSGTNSCGGKAVPQSQRKAWFRRLKRGYPNSKWAKKLKYYW